MFSNLTNQVTNWMGKKPENGTDMPDPTKVREVPEGEPQEKKDSSPTKIGGKLEMLAGVKTQMSGWISGGIQGLTRGGVPGAAENEGQVLGEGSEAQLTQNIQETPDDQVKDDDASRLDSDATGGADSGPASLEGTPTEDKNDQQAFGAVSTKALAGAKTLGGFLYSAVNKAGKTVVEAGAMIKKTVGENRLIADLNKEQEAFIASKQAGEKGEAVAPWVGAPNEDKLREECLSLSTDRRNFMRAPPPGAEFEWNFEAVQPMAQATLALDPNLEKMRFELVPSLISEENFWRNYFYRVSVLRQNHELDAMSAERDQSETNLQSGLSADNGMANQVQTSQRQDSTCGTVTTSNTGLTDSPAHEFVSDSMRVTDRDLEEVRQGMKKLGMQPPKEEDWERELESELKDYEVVSSGEAKSVVASSARSTKDPQKDDWEKQIDELLANEDEEDLK